MDFPKRTHPRLKGYHYASEGAYFLTLCTKERAPFLGKIVGDSEKATVLLTRAGIIAERYIHSISDAYPNIFVHAYVIMPDHIHLILRIGWRAESSRPTIPQIVACFKRFTNRDCKQKLWQDSYYDHVIRDEEDYLTKLQYIETNPLRYFLKQE